ncbi:MAG: hypothetical protein JSR36_03355 [Proteobacteria bacterium]|nr:hypothetical protein [Pseudomonadota bacterium]
MRISSVVKAVLAVTAVAVPLLAHAESNVVSGASTATPGAVAHVDFQVTIPKILFLRVGTGSTYTGATPTLGNVNTVDLVQFAPAAGSVGNGTAVAGAGGDLTGGAVTAAIVSNSGNVTLNATTAGAMTDGAAGDTIAWTQITTAATTITSATALTAPTLANGASNNVVLTAPATKLILADAKWTYSYANTVNPPAGIYGGVNTNNGRVTYTATMP